jgi:hypothetical protein
MSKKNKLHQGELDMIELGLYVTYPINLNALLTQSERDVLNAIRHCLNVGERYISISVFRLMTGLSENTIRKARDALLKLDIIKKGKETTIGTEYTIKYETLCPIVAQLNEEKNPIQRLIDADKFRGEGREINKILINDFKKSEFNFK